MNARQVHESEKSGLYDVVWFEQRTDEHGATFLTDLPLVAEVEWHHTLYEICYDFEKILQARAGHKVMIFRAYDARVALDIITKLESRITKFEMSQSGDRYLFAGLVGEHNRFQFQLFVMCAPMCGP